MESFLLLLFLFFLEIITTCGCCQQELLRKIKSFSSISKRLSALCGIRYPVGALLATVTIICFLDLFIDVLEVLGHVGPRTSTSSLRPLRPP